MSNSFTITNEADLSSSKVESAVAMAVYLEDRMEWLKEAVNSILAQDYRDFLFFIVIDGHISSQMQQYLFTTANRNKRIILIQSSENVGLSSCMNYVIDVVSEKMPSVEFFFRMDSDDISMPNRLSRQISFLQENPEVSILGTSLVEVNEKGKKVGQRLLPQAHVQIMQVLPRRCAINHPTVAIRMKVFSEGVRYRSQLLNTQDYVLWIELSARGFIFANLPDILLKFRRVNDFYKRRGLSKSLNEFNARFLAMRKLNRMTLFNVTYAFSVIVLRLMPSKIIKLAYKVDRYVLKKRDNK